MATKDRSLTTGFQHVDNAERPDTFVEMLDEIRAQDAVTAWKLQACDLLGDVRGGHLVDVGCGTGDDALLMAERVGPSGSVVGIDCSDEMIREAQRRTAGTGLPVAFRLGDALALDFTDDLVDGAHAERLLVHLQEPERALAEMVRVTRPGGRVVVTEPDMGTWHVNHPDRAVTRRIMDFFCDSFANGWAGRNAIGWFRAQPLANLVYRSNVQVFPDYETGEKVQQFGMQVRRAVDGGAISSAEADAWVAGLEEFGRSGRYLTAVTMYTVAGTK